MLFKTFSLYSSQLKAHIRQQHRNLTSWHCGHCSTVAKTQKQLTRHIWQYHELGRFKCAQPQCNLTADTRYVVLSHQKVHAPKKYLCKFRGCTQSFLDDFKLASHERVHLSSKPYKCSLDGCAFAAVQRSNMTRHIRTKHFKLPVSIKEQNRRGIVDQRNPADYIEVDEDLLALRLQ